MTRRMVHQVAAAALTVMLGMTAVGCSEDDSRPSKDDYRDALMSDATEGEDAAETAQMEKAADCLVDESYDDLSDESIQAVIDEDEDYKASQDDTKVWESAMKKCMEDLADEMPGLDAE